MTMFGTSDSWSVSDNKKLSHKLSQWQIQVMLENAK